MHGGFKLEPHEWAQLRALLDQALDLPAAERDHWLETLSADRAAYRPRLRALLVHAVDGEASRRMESLPRIETADFAPAPGSRPLAADTTRVGPYRLLRELGSGGMASVWLAERTDMLQRRQVALKLPHGAWRRAGLAERMAREREILATLQHPNIATLFDAGLAEDGQPYLALEYIEGERIDTYCERKQLDVQATLRLFLQVARAVAHAHAHLVVHRDLKPSNILVNEVGEVKLLDFGIAKLLDQGDAAETELTQQSGRALTPDYAAPEQIKGQPIGTSADVYALGVVLFELLTGTRPYALVRDSRAALEEAIMQADAPRPSSVAPSSKRKALQGDLDTIVLKALKKDPALRYATVDALAEDIGRHLGRRPVLAQPDSRWYRACRFVARNQLAVVAAALVFLAVVAGAGMSTWQAALARQEQARAEEVKDFVAAIFKDANPFQQGSGKALTGVELLRIARDKLGATSIARPQTRIELLSLLGSSLLSLEDADSAQTVLSQAVAESKRAMGPEHIDTLRASRLLAEAYRVQEKPDEARTLMEQLLPALRRLRATNASDLVEGLLVLANVAAKQTRFDEAQSLLEEGLAVVQTHLGGQGPEQLALLGLLANVHRVAGRSPEALDTTQRAYVAAQRLHGSQAKHPAVTDARYMLAFVLADNGKGRESVQEFRGVLTDTAALFGDTSRRLGTRLGASSEMFSEAGFMQEAIDNTQRACQVLAAYAPPASRLLTACTEVRGLALVAARRGHEGALDLARARDGYRELFGPDNFTVMVTQRNLSRALAYAGNFEAAESEMARVLTTMPHMARDGYDANSWIAGLRERLAGRPRAALALQARALESLAGDGPANVLPRARSLTERGLSELAIGDAAAARSTLLEALALYERRGVDLAPEHADALLGLGRIDLEAGAAAQALPRLQRVDAFWRGLDAGSRWAGEAAFWLGRCHAALGQRRETAAAYARAAQALATSSFPGDAELRREAQRGT